MKPWVVPLVPGDLPHELCKLIRQEPGVLALQLPAVLCVLGSELAVCL
jgi:hypothetical protein